MDAVLAVIQLIISIVLIFLVLLHSGKDAGLVTAEKIARANADPQIGIERHVDLGFVGHPVAVDRSILDTLSQAGIIPVIAPIAPGVDGDTYNINADTMAGAIAAAIGASRLFLLTDVAGVLDGEGTLLTELDPARIAALQAKGVVTGGMIPKLETCIDAVNGGVECVIASGRHPELIADIVEGGGSGTRFPLPRAATK